ncbi:MAG: hypothetical protein ACRBG0_01405 [Lewinella sp.]|uniref:hypothetical protein n=1 Tax=Lewinella sp. TaxID=2004506 RepID=UPI003D6B5265
MKQETLVLTQIAPSTRLNTPVTFFRSVKVLNGAAPLKVVTLEALFEETSKDACRQKTEFLRSLKMTDTLAYKKQKVEELTPFVIGDWEVRGILNDAPPLILFDIDGGDENSYLSNFYRVSDSPYVYRMEQSVGGGTRIYVWASYPEGKRKDAYLAIAQHLSEVLGVPLKKKGEQQDEHIDTSTSDISRMWFPAYTTPTQIYYNEQSEVFEYTPLESKKHNGSPTQKLLPKYKIEFTEEEKVQDVIRQIEERQLDLTSGVEAWFAKVLLPLANQFGEVGRQYVHAVSRFHPDYNANETDQEFDRALKKDKGLVSIGSFLAHAQVNGVSYDAQRIMAQRESVNGQPRSLPPPSPKPAPLRRTPNGVLIIQTPDPVIDQELPAPESGSLEIKDGRYYLPSNRRGKEHVSNFTITPLYLLTDSREPKRILQCTNIFDESAIICCPVRSLSKPSEFAAIIEGKGNFVPSWTGSQFSVIKEYLYQHEMQAEEIAILGHQPETNLYAFANGVFDGENFYEVNEYGIVDINDQKYYLPAFSKVNEDAEQEYHNERKFVFQAGNSSFSEWASCLCAVFGNNAKVGICYVVAAVFRDIVFRYANCFPLLFLFGPKGTGKTTFRNAMHRLFGQYGAHDAIGLGSASSPKGFARKLAQVRNGLQAFEEYKNKISPNLIEMLKNVYDGIGYERAQTTNDNRTHATLVNSAVILGGQEMPTKENALFSRVLLLLFNKTKFSAAEKAAYNELERKIEGGLGDVLLEILQHRKIVEENFLAVFQKVYGHLRKDSVTSHLEERTLTNVAALLTPFKILSAHLEFPFDYKEAYIFIRERIKAQAEYMSKTNEVNQFWQVFDALDQNKIHRDTHYKITGGGLLSIDLKRVFPIYYEQATKQNLNVLDESTLKSYLMMQSYFQSAKDNRSTTRVTLGEPPFAKSVRCMQFQVEGMKDLDLDFIERKS